MLGNSRNRIGWYAAPLALVALLAHVPATALALPTADQLCRFKNLKAVGVVTKKWLVCNARYAKNPTFGLGNCFGRAARAFYDTMATIEAAGGCRVDREKDKFIQFVLGFEYDTRTQLNTTGKFAFVTSTTYTGDFGGPFHADFICRERAFAANLPLGSM